MPLHPPAEVRPGRPALHPHSAHDLTLLHHITLFDQNFRLVQIGGDQALAVIEKGESALKVQTCLSKGHQAAGRRPDGRPHGGSHVDAVMGAFGLAI